MSDEQVERVAKAISAQCYDKTEGGWQPSIPAAMEMAVEVIAAMQPTPQEAAKVMLGVGRWSDMEKAFSAMDARWEDGPEAALSSALRAIAGEARHD